MIEDTDVLDLAEMHVMDEMDAATRAKEYQALVTAWSAHFTVPAPTVRLSQRTSGLYTYTVYQNGRRVPPQSRIAMPASGASWNGFSAVEMLVHEFAHHLHAAPGHGERFCRALRAVAAHVLGDPKVYAWAKEYRRIAKWAVAHGLLAAAVLHTNHEHTEVSDHG